MATSKIWAVHTSSGNKIGYIEDKEKTTASIEDLVPVVTEGVKTDNGRLVAGLNCDPWSAMSEMESVKQKFSKTDGVQAYHGYISFGPKDSMSATDVLKVAKEVAEDIWGDRFQVVLAVHNNTNTLHCHFVVNSVSFVDGLKARDNEHNYYYLKQKVDEKCKKYDLAVTEPYSRKIVPKGEVIRTLYEAKAQASGDRVAFDELLREKGFKFISDDRVRAPDGKRYITTDLDPKLTIKAADFKTLDTESVAKPVVPAVNKTVEQEQKKGLDLSFMEDISGRKVDKE